VDDPPEILEDLPVDLEHPVAGLLRDSVQRKQLVQHDITHAPPP
jgi:hypothetical protein